MKKSLLLIVCLQLFVYSFAQQHELTFVPNYLPPFFSVENRSPDYIAGRRSDLVKNAGEMQINDVMLYPNPASDAVTVAFTQKNTPQVTIALIDMIGNPVLSWDEATGEQPFRKVLALEEVPSGIYFVGISAGKEKVVRKLIIRK